MRAGVFGRSRVWTCSLVAEHGGFAFSVSAGVFVGSGAGVCCFCGPVMSTLQRRGPVGSRFP
jgi:hypothetical protein